SFMARGHHGRYATLKRIVDAHYNQNLRVLGAEEGNTTYRDYQSVPILAIDELVSHENRGAGIVLEDLVRERKNACLCTIFAASDGDSETGTIEREFGRELADDIEEGAIVVRLHCSGHFDGEARKSRDKGFL